MLFKIVHFILQLQITLYIYIYITTINVLGEQRLSVNLKTIPILSVLVTSLYKAR